MWKEVVFVGSSLWNFTKVSSLQCYLMLEIRKFGMGSHQYGNTQLYLFKERPVAGIPVLVSCQDAVVEWYEMVKSSKIEIYVAEEAGTTGVAISTNL